MGRRGGRSYAPSDPVLHHAMGRGPLPRSSWLLIPEMDARVKGRLIFRCEWVFRVMVLPLASGGRRDSNDNWSL